VDSISQNKLFVPAPNRYNRDIDWKTNPSDPSLHFTKNKKMTITDEIFYKSKFKEKSTPGANQYIKEKAHKSTIAKVGGTYEPREKRTTFVIS